MIRRLVGWRSTLGVIDAFAPPAIFVALLAWAHLRAGLLGGTFFAFLTVRSVFRIATVLRDVERYRFDARRLAVGATVVLVFDIALLLVHEATR
jgi:hypothetical protein